MFSVWVVQFLYAEKEFQGAVLIHPCSKILALNFLTSNSPLSLDAKHERAFCDRSQCQRLKSTSCNVVGFLKTCKRTTFPPAPKMNGSGFLKNRRQGHSKCSSQWSCIHTSQHSTPQFFRPGQFPKLSLIRGMLCHHRQRPGYWWICRTGTSHHKLFPCC